MNQHVCSIAGHGDMDAWVAELAARSETKLELVDGSVCLVEGNPQHVLDLLPSMGPFDPKINVTAA